MVHDLPVRFIFTRRPSAFYDNFAVVLRDPLEATLGWYVWLRLDMDGRIQSWPFIFTSTPLCGDDDVDMLVVGRSGVPIPQNENTTTDYDRNDKENPKFAHG